MILSQTAVYALKAVLHLAERGGDGPVRVDDIAAELDVPRNYLSKILHALARAKLLDSTRGPRGGFELVAIPEETPLEQVVELFDGFVGGPTCLLGRAECSDRDPCAAHDRWKETAAAVRKFFRETTLADLSHSEVMNL